MHGFAKRSEVPAALAWIDAHAAVLPAENIALEDAVGRTLAADVSGGTGRVGVRVPANVVARAICAEAGRPITATSANVSGTPATPDPDQVERALGDRLDLLIDAGTTPGGAPSTIVDVTGADPALVRAGAISWDEIQAWLQSALAHPPAR